MILLLFPFRDELDAFLAGTETRREAEVRGIPVYGSAAGEEWRLAVCGQGKAEAALACQILSDALQPRAILLIGSAVALDPGLGVGDAVLADPCLEWDFDAEPPPRFRPAAPFPEIPGLRAGPILSGDRNVFDPGRKADLFRRFGALALAWEGAGFHRCLRRNGWTGWEIRIVTEAAEEGRLELNELQARMRRHFPKARDMLVQAAIGPEIREERPGTAGTALPFRAGEK